MYGMPGSSVILLRQVMQDLLVAAGQQQEGVDQAGQDVAHTGQEGP